MWFDFVFCCVFVNVSLNISAVMIVGATERESPLK